VGAAVALKLRRPNVTLAHNMRATAAICPAMTGGNVETTERVTMRPASPATITRNASADPIFAMSRSF